MNPTSCPVAIAEERASNRPLSLPDILAPGLDLIVVGINPSLYSAERGQYFARPSNMFWRCLWESGLVPERLGPADSPRLPEYGIGLTDIVKRATHRAADIRPAEFRAGRERLRETLIRHAPRAVCFVGKLAYQEFSGRRKVAFGRQPERIGSAVVVVIPSTSGRANGQHHARMHGLAEIRAYLAESKQAMSRETNTITVADG